MTNIQGQATRDDIAQPADAIPYPTIRRMPAYHRCLKVLQADGIAAVSCTKIAETLELEPIQVRKDMAMTGTVGRPRIGYPVDQLIAAIENLLGWDQRSDAFLIGAGNLGSAILGYKPFKELGLDIVAAFDNDPRRVGKTIHGVSVLPVEKVANLARRMRICIGVITVPAASAVAAARTLISGGIEAIWNFSPMTLTAGDVPPEVIIENVSLAASLAVLTHRLADAKARRAPRP